MGYPARPDDPACPLLHWRDGGVAHLRFNRPQALNAIDRAMARAFLGACEDLAADPAVRAVRISGEGRAFMAGGDLVELRQDPRGAADELLLEDRSRRQVSPAPIERTTGKVKKMSRNCGCFLLKRSGISISTNWPISSDFG